MSTDGPEAWYLHWLPHIATVVVTVAVVAYLSLTWPAAPVLAGGVVTDGRVITASREEGMVRFGYTLEDGSTIFRNIPIAEGFADPAYDWHTFTAGSPIDVLYDPADAESGIPFLEFPYWATGAWGVVSGFLAASLSVWLRHLLRKRRARAH